MRMLLVAPFVIVLYDGQYLAALLLLFVAAITDALDGFLARHYGAFAHGVDDNTRAFLQQNTGTQITPFLYIGAKHMITGYDHLLFLVGVLFFLYRSRDVL
ncbi:MAG: hypothetical protein COA99_05200, partial [Moraxellaceae bacterium]